MPKKKDPPESQEEQSERFKKAVSDAVAAGELNPAEADEVLDALVRRRVGGANSGQATNTRSR